MSILKSAMVTGALFGVLVGIPSSASAQSLSWEVFQLREAVEWDSFQRRMDAQEVEFQNTLRGWDAQDLRDELREQAAQRAHEAAMDRDRRAHEQEIKRITDQADREEQAAQRAHERTMQRMYDDIAAIKQRREER